MLEVVQSGTRPALEEAFDRGLHECCIRHGVDALVRNVPPDEQLLTRVVVVRDRDGVLLGGGRVHERHPTKGFPAEQALRHFVAIRGRVRELAPNDTVELASFWTTAAGRKSGVPRLVAQACMASAVATGKRTAFMVSHAQFAPVLRGIGMTPVEGVAEVPFPTASYRSRIHTADLAVLAGAGRSDREVIGTIVRSLRAGTSALELCELASIEYGGPVWSLGRRTTQRLRSVA
jgi:hypothetical protein